MEKNICKIIIVGDGGTGKSTLIETRKTGNFNSAPKITIGIDFACFPACIDHTKITFLIFDLGGQKRFHFMHNSYIVGTRAAIILYDLTRPLSFDNIPYWVSLIKDENKYIPILICGSKLDLIQPEDAILFKQKWEKLRMTINPEIRIIDHVLVSAKDFNAVEEIFVLVGREIVNHPEINILQKSCIQQHQNQ